MKKIIAFSVFLLPSLALAQFSKHQVYIGGSFDASLHNNDVPAVPPTIQRIIHLPYCQWLAFF
jgi:hypothetical protein